MSENQWNIQIFVRLIGTWELGARVRVASSIIKSCKSSTLRLCNCFSGHYSSRLIVVVRLRCARKLLDLCKSCKKTDDLRLEAGRGLCKLPLNRFVSSLGSLQRRATTHPSDIRASGRS